MFRFLYTRPLMEFIAAPSYADVRHSTALLPPSPKFGEFLIYDGSN